MPPWACKTFRGRSKNETRAAVATGVTTWGMQLATTAVRKTLISAERAEDVPPWMNVFPILTELGDEHSMVDYYLTAKIMNDTQASEVAELTREGEPEAKVVGNPMGKYTARQLLMN